MVLQKAKCHGFEANYKCSNKKCYHHYNETHGDKNGMGDESYLCMIHRDKDNSPLRTLIK